MSEGPGFKTLVTKKCAKQVTISIRNNLEDVSGFLMDKEIIDYTVYRKARDMSKSSDDRAALVCDNLSIKVEGDDQLYNTFVEYLRADYSRYRVTVDLLDEVYVQKCREIPGKKAPDKLTPATKPDLPIGRSSSLCSCHTFTMILVSVWKVFL